MKFFISLVVVFVSASAFASDATVQNFCTGSVNFTKNVFVVDYDTNTAKLDDVTRVLNILGGMGYSVGLKITKMGPQFNFANTSIEKELSGPRYSFGQFQVEFDTDKANPDYVAQLKPKALALLEAIAGYDGFTVRCRPNLASPLN